MILQSEVILLGESVCMKHIIYYIYIYHIYPYVIYIEREGIKTEIDCITSYSSNHSIVLLASSLNACKNMVVHMHLFNCFYEGSHCVPCQIYFSPVGVDTILPHFEHHHKNVDLIDQVMEHLGC